MKRIGLLFVVILFYVGCKSMRPQDPVVILTPLEQWRPFVYVKPTDLGDTLAAYRPLAGFGHDTTAYLKANFENRKGLYVGHPLGKLLDELEMPIPRYSYRFSDKYWTQYSGMRLKLHRGRSKTADGDLVFNHIIMIIDWTEPLPRPTADSLRSKYKGGWSEEVDAYYRKQIVGDVRVFNHVLP